MNICIIILLPRSTWSPRNRCPVQLGTQGTAGPRSTWNVITSLINSHIPRNRRREWNAWLTNIFRCKSTCLQVIGPQQTHTNLFQEKKELLKLIDAQFDKIHSLSNIFFFKPERRNVNIISKLCLVWYRES